MREPDWKERYEITLYQMGWRLGGKGASGVNREIGYRVEEHGLHLWMGFYENAFAMMRGIYGDLKRPPGAPLATFDEAFKGQPFMIFEEPVGEAWVDWKINFPKMAGEVGDGKPVTWEDLITNMFAFLRDAFHAAKNLPDATPEAEHHFIWQRLKEFVFPPAMHEALQHVEQKMEDGLAGLAEKMFREMVQLMIRMNDFHNGHHLTMLHNLRKWIWDLVGEAVYRDTDARRLWVSTDLIVAMLSGMIANGVLKCEDGKVSLDYPLINDYDYADWLVMHGADKALTIPSPLVKSMYDGPFAFKNGDITQGNAEAGTMLNIFLRLAFTCKESVVFRMQAGMGDTIFAPAYELFIREGVKVKFFYKVVDMKLSTSKKTVEQLLFHKQVKLKNGDDDYNPLFDVKGLPCWPSEPLYEQVNDEQATQLQAEGINLESAWAVWHYKEEITLQRGVDFDEVIIGASLASLPHFAYRLIDANPAWQKMLSKVATVQTQAFQFWLNKDAAALGIDDDKLLSAYVEPLDTFSAMNQILKREQWPNDEAKFVAYICGAYTDAANILPYHVHGFPKWENNLVRENMLAYLKQDLRHIIPAAFGEDGDFDWNLLVDLQNREGEERIDGQYIRANIDPSERYVLSLAGSSKYRLRADESGFENVWLTGDWIQNGMNAGFVEGAVVSGILTARALHGNDAAISLVIPEWDKVAYAKKDFE